MNHLCASLLTLCLGGALAQAQSAPLKASAKRVAGAQGDALGTSVQREAKLRVALQNVSGQTLEGVSVEWMFVTESGYSYLTKHYHAGKREVDLKSLQKMEFDTDFVEVARANYQYGPRLKGHWVKVNYANKTIFEEYNPQSIKKFVDQQRKEPETKEIP